MRKAVGLVVLFVLVLSVGLVYAGEEKGEGLMDSVKGLVPGKKAEAEKAAKCCSPDPSKGCCRSEAKKECGGVESKIKEVLPGSEKK